MRGVRIQNIVNELGGEKIDIVQWAPEEVQFIANALSPAKVEHVWLDPETRTATVVVPDTQLSLAIGKEGQNARLAAKLTNWRIDIKSITDAAGEVERRAREAAEAAEREAELAAKREAAAALLAAAERSLIEEEAAVQEVPVVPTPEPAETAASAEEVTEAALTVELPGTEVEAAALAAGEKEAPSVLEVAEAPKETLEAQPTPEAPVAVPSTQAELVVAGELAVGESDEDEEYDREEQQLRKKGGKHRGRELVLDEESGVVVSRKRRKKSRSLSDWKDFEDH
jgi:N utilization substance protein A